MRTLDDPDYPGREQILDHLERVARAAPEPLLRMDCYGLPTRCGTAHCLAGWAALDPWFEAETALPAVLERTPEDDPSEVAITRDALFATEPPSGLFGAALRLDPVDAERLLALDCAHLLGLRALPAVTRDEVLANLARLKAGAPAVSYLASRDFLAAEAR